MSIMSRGGFLEGYPDPILPERRGGDCARTVSQEKRRKIRVGKITRVEIEEGKIVKCQIIEQIIKNKKGNMIGI